jgi:hypothetical protein
MVANQRALEHLKGYRNSEISIGSTDREAGKPLSVAENACVSLNVWS